MTVSGTIDTVYTNEDVSGKPYNRRLLRITSLIFALMLALFCIGLGGRIYMDRAIGGLIDQSAIRLTGEHRQILTQWLAGIARQDAQAVHFAEVDMEKLNAEYHYSADGSFFIMMEPDPDKTYDYSISEPSAYTGKTKASMQDDLAQFNSIARGVYGAKWSMMRLAGYYWVLMLAGGILALAALVFWFAKGGRVRNISDTAIVPLGAVIIGIGIAFILVFCFISADFTISPHIVISDSGVTLVR